LDLELVENLIELRQDDRAIEILGQDTLRELLMNDERNLGRYNSMVQRLIILNGYKKVASLIKIIQELKPNNPKTIQKMASLLLAE
jgi:hypothetical protein